MCAPQHSVQSASQHSTSIFSLSQGAQFFNTVKRAAALWEQADKVVSQIFDVWDGLSITHNLIWQICQTACKGISQQLCDFFFFFLPNFVDNWDMQSLPVLQLHHQMCLHVMDKLIHKSKFKERSFVRDSLMMLWFKFSGRNVCRKKKFLKKELKWQKIHYSGNYHCGIWWNQLDPKNETKVEVHF